MKRVEQKLRAWFTYIQKRYDWLTIKFEYSSNRGCYVVSFSPETMISLDEEFCEEAMNFEDEMNEEFENEAPLFCDDEKLFKLSPNAEILPSKLESVSFAGVTNDETVKLTHFNFVNMFVQNSQCFAEETNSEESHYYDKMAA